jgi:hypothetical protein
MDAVRQEMVKIATEKFGSIHAVNNRESLEECFSEEEGMLIFWFNTEDNSTHIVTRAV